MTTAQIELTAADAGIPAASQEPSLTASPGAPERLRARQRVRGALAMLARTPGTSPPR
jgi:hypothetical protein